MCDCGQFQYLLLFFAESFFEPDLSGQCSDACKIRIIMVVTMTFTNHSFICLLNQHIVSLFSYKNSSKATTNRITVRTAA